MQSVNTTSEFELFHFIMGKNKPEKLSRIEEWRRQQKEKNRQNNEKYNEKNREKKAAAAREKSQLKKAHPCHAALHVSVTWQKKLNNEFTPLLHIMRNNFRGGQVE